MLGIINPSQALANLKNRDKGICTIYTPGGYQEMLTVTESGL